MTTVGPSTAANMSEIAVLLIGNGLGRVITPTRSHEGTRQTPAAIYSHRLRQSASATSRATISVPPQRDDEFLE